MFIASALEDKTTGYVRLMKCLGFIFSLIFYAGALQAEDKDSDSHNKWELGAGVGALSIPDYRGSNQRNEYVLPIPYLRYYGDKLKVDRDGGRFYLYEDESFNADISMAFAPPVESDENAARQGMPDLDYVIEVGPRLQFNLYESEDKDFRFRFFLPVRAAIATDFNSAEYIGITVSPYLETRYHLYEWEHALSMGPMWASDKYHDYFYEVKSQYATTQRPEYNPSSGYNGSRITYTLSKRYKKVFIGFFTRYDSLKGVSFKESPLVKQDDSFMFGLALSWVFVTSKTRVKK